MKPTPTSQGSTSPVATEIRRQRQALRLTLTEVSERAGVSIGFLSMLERGQRRPSYDRLQRVWAALGISQTLPVVAPALTAEPSPRSMAELIGAHLAAGPTTIADLARATDASVDRVQSALTELDRLLEPAGMTVVRDATRAVVTSRADLRAAVSGSVPTRRRASLTQDQYLALAVSAHYGAITRRQLDDLRGVDSHELLVGLVELGLLSSVMDDRAPGRPRIYRLTTVALDTLGVSSVEELKALLPAGLDPAP